MFAHMTGSLQHLYFTLGFCTAVSPVKQRQFVNLFVPSDRVTTACELPKLVNSSGQTCLSANVVNNCWATAPYK